MGSEAGAPYRDLPNLYRGAQLQHSLDPQIKKKAPPSEAIEDIV